MAKPACWIELRYGWGLQGIAIAQSGNLELLRQAKNVILAEAKRKAQISKQVDSVLGLIEEQELVKLERILQAVGLLDENAEAAA